MCRHMHTPTHTPAHAHSCAGTRTHLCTCLHTHLHTRAGTRTHTCRHTHVSVVHTQPTCLHIYLCTCINAHECTPLMHTCVQIQHMQPHPLMLKAWESPNSPQHNFRLWHQLICELIALSSKYPLTSIPKVIIKVSLTSQFRGCYLCAPRVRAEYGTKSSLTRRVPGKDVGGL